MQKQKPGSQCTSVDVAGKCRSTRDDSTMWVCQGKLEVIAILPSPQASLDK